MRIQHNIPGMRTLRYGKKLNSDTAKTLEKLSSGYCINRAGDDAAGLAVSERIRMSLTEFGRCKDNIQEGINLANTADAALQEVNDMLNRAQELCVAAANGTYSRQEKAELQKELDTLYSEVDRIFESSRFNEVELFRHESTNPKEGYYAEVECVIPSNELLEWGELSNVQSRPFDTATPAVGSTVTVTPDVTLNHAADLGGKSVNIGGTTYYFDYNQSDNGTDLVGLSNIVRVDISGCASVDDALDKLCAATNGLLDKDGTKVNDDGTITFQMAPATLNQNIEANGSSFTYPAPEANSQNGTAISSTEQKSLLEVSTQDVNTFSYANITTTLTLKTDSQKKIDNNDLKNLLGNKLRFYRSVANGNSTTGSFQYITFTEGSDNGTAIHVDTNMTFTQLYSKIADVIGGQIDGFDAKYTSNSGSMEVTCEANGNAFVSVSVSEERPVSNSSYDYKDEVVSVLDVNTIKREGTNEQTEQWTVTLPSKLPEGHFSAQIGNSTYLFYNSSKFESGYHLYTYGNASSTYNISGKTEEEVYNTIKNLIINQYSSSADVSLSGNTITVACKKIGDHLTGDIKGNSATLKTRKVAQSSSYTTDAVLISKTNSSKQKYSMTMNLGEKMANADPSGLYGTGFAFASSKYLYSNSDTAYTWYEFSNGNNQTSDASSTRTGAVQVDISGCSTYSDVAATLQTAMGNNVTVTADNATGILTISGERSASSYSPSFKEGVAGLDGLFTGDLAAGQLSNIQTVYTTNGTDAGQPTAEIDFSGYDSSNFNELHGKGFRVTCATCKGEYINVVFCYDKGQLDFPKSFEEEDKDSGAMRTIHNLVVELKDMTDGSDIVRAIVDQLASELDHYTDVAIGNPSSVLKVFDKRQGDIKDADGNLLRAEVLSGVRTNFIYTTREQFVSYVDDRLGDIDIAYIGAEIYVGSEPEPQYIDIHLPYLTLENLKMNPPEPDLSTTESATATLERAKAANNVISYVRGTLGADCNRLEHAYADLAQAEEQAADAFSRIRDADMAEQMMEYTKLSILMQAQQAAQSHTMQQPQSVLKLMQ